MYLQNYYPIINQNYKSPYVFTPYQQQTPKATYYPWAYPYVYPTDIYQSKQKPTGILNNPEAMGEVLPTYREDEKPYLESGVHTGKLFNYLAKKGDIDRFLELYSFDTGTSELRKSYLKYKNSPELNALYKNKLFNNEEGSIRLSDTVHQLDKQADEPQKMNQWLMNINNFVNSNLSDDLKKFIIFGTDSLKSSYFTGIKLSVLNPQKPNIEDLYYPEKIPTM